MPGRETAGRISEQIFIFQRVANQSVRAFEFEFAADVAAVCFDGQRADEQQFADFLIGFVFGDVFENLFFGLSQIGKLWTSIEAAAKKNAGLIRSR